MKRFFFLMTVLLILGMSHATAQKEGDDFWWGYYQTGGLRGSIGVAKPQTYNCAIALLNSGVLEGSTVKAVKIWLYSPKMKDLKIWASHKLPETPEQADVFCKSIAPGSYVVGSEELDCGLPNTFEFDEPFIINGKGVYMGYSFRVDDVNGDYDYENAYPVVASFQADDLSNAFWFKTDSEFPEWGSRYGTGQGNLAMQVLVSSERAKVPGAASIPESISETIAVAGNQVSVNVPLTNESINGINSIDYTLSVDGVAGKEIHAELTSPVTAVGGIGNFSLPFTASAADGIHSYEFKITKVNNTDNGTQNNISAKFDVLTVAQSSPRRVVMEEYTSTTLNQCPRGIVGIQGMSDMFGQQFIAIAVHHDDVMTPSQAGYYPDVEIHPWAAYNRSVWADPFLGIDYTDKDPFGARYIVMNQMSEVTEGSVGLTATWNSDKTALTLDSETVFQYTATNTDYSLAYVLTEDNMSGPSPEWDQANGYSGDTYYSKVNPGFIPFVEGGASVAGLKYKNVAVATESIEHGIDGSIPADIKCGEKVAHSHTFDIASNKLIQDKENLNAIVLLIDRRSGRIVNAAKTSLGNSGVEAVSESAERTVVARFTVDGRPIDAPVPGINIVKYSDGTVSKVLVRR